MARANKYASLNFNDIYDKKNTSTTNKTLNNTSTPSLHKTIISNSRIHGNMLVLTRPTPKPISSQAQTQAQTQPKSQIQQQPAPPSVNPDPTRLEAKSDSISLRPLGSTGGSVGVSKLPKDLSFVSGKVEKFVPPHLRPGYVCKEEKPEVVIKNRQRQFGEEGSRPKSGGGVGYDRMKRGSAGPDFVFRPGSSGGNRPNSSG